MSDDSTYRATTDLASIERCWPVGHEVPKLIIEMAELIAPWEISSVGFANFRGSRFDDYWCELGGDLSEQFGKFISLPDGTDIAIWFHENAVKGAEPVVELGSEGELNTLAPNLKSFMLKWAEGRVQRELDPDPSTETPQYFVQRKLYAEKMRELINKTPHGPASAPVASLPKFLEQWQTKAFAKVAADPVMKEIVQLLHAHIPIRPEGADPETHYVFPTAFQIRVAGGRVEIQPPALPPDYTTFKPLPEHDALIPLILKAREARAKDVPGRGAWHDAMLEIYEDGTLFLKASWEFEPSFRKGGRITRAELDADLTRFPRDPRWMQAWMNELT